MDKNTEAFIEEVHAVAQRYGFTLAWDNERSALLVRQDPNADIRMVRLRQPGDEPPPRMPSIEVGAQRPTLTGLREVNTPIAHPPEFWEQVLRDDEDKPKS